MQINQSMYPPRQLQTTAGSRNFRRIQLNNQLMGRSRDA
jgi:hypothetical protein